MCWAKYQVYHSSGYGLLGRERAIVVKNCNIDVEWFVFVDSNKSVLIRADSADKRL